MPGIIPGYEYDIFISYRQKDNKGDRWVSEFVDTSLREKIKCLAFVPIIPGTYCDPKLEQQDHACQERTHYPDLINSSR